jgi:hypothetical protein
MYRHIVHAFGGFHNGFGDGRVGVDDAQDLMMASC